MNSNSLSFSPPSRPQPTGRSTPRIPPGVEYHRVFAGERRRIGRGVFAILLLLVGMFAFSIAIGRSVTALGDHFGYSGGVYSPLQHGAGMFSLALLIPWSMLIQRWLYGMQGASLHSVVSGFRWDLFARALLFIGPLWLAVAVTQSLWIPKEQTFWSVADLVAMLALTLLLTPLQSAGEEYGFRGLVFRIAGGWARGPRAALVLGVLVSSLAFVLAHASTDPWYNVWYFTFAAGTALITWRTGGLETAIVLHALNNTLLFLFDIGMHTDFSTLFDRAAGSASAALIVPCVSAVAVTAVVWWRTRESGPALTPSEPGPPFAERDSRSQGR
ncbi:type II CAAX endopeptidase family protein [Nocardiopsis sp. MG754419]|uniref:CPBP family intramembrane glutamic endopeptidase n=1 Tax=Nocardiopsis sp. MG754419 TaxID=2259865 RepID=UPI0027DC6FA0|nr:type II CAAX endopeptidase family protein [Nocardiopsis sp. MG754419]MBR8740783.1 CPBP family intramembrane metalloprotease domain-containing protein [Nocardiopsis sp. MG754419]